MANVLHLTTGVVYVRSASGMTFTGPLLAADGTAAAPSLTFSADTDTGFFRPGTNLIDVALGGAAYTRFQIDIVELKSTVALGWSAGALGAGRDVEVFRGTANRLDLASGDSFALVDGNINIHKPSIGVTSTDGLILDNATAAAAGAQQMSPRIRFDGFGWKTDATAASQAVSVINELLPVEGASAPTANLLWKYAVNGGAYSTIGTLNSVGDFTAGRNLVASGDVIAASGNRLSFSSRSQLFSPADAQLGWRNSAENSGIGFAFASNVLTIKTLDQTAGGSIAALERVTTASGDGAITIQPGVVNITKGTAAALTLADPAAADAGTIIWFTSQTAAAHTVSNAAGSGFNAGGAGSDVATFGGAIGDCFAVIAINAKWNILFLRNVTLS